jgi:hypothetical protein
VTKLATFARFAFLALSVVAVSVIAGSPVAGVCSVVAQVVATPLAAGLIGCLLAAAYLLEGRDAGLPLTLLASRTFIVGTWVLSLAMLWFVTLAVTPQAYETVTAGFNVVLAVCSLAHRQWKGGSFWPSRTDWRLDKLTAHLRDVFAAIDRLAA